VLKAFWWLVRCRLECIPRRRFPGLSPPARPLRSMHTGQNSIPPENSLPQLGQMRWGSALMLLIAVQSHPQPETTPLSTDWCEIGPAQPLAHCYPVPQTIGCSLIY
jgi:hypothetical protein